MTVQGTIRDHTSTGMLEIHVEDIPLGGRLTEVVMSSELTGEDIAEPWAWAAPRGRASVDLRVPLNDDPRPLELSATLRGVSVRLNAEGDVEPVEVSKIEATLVHDGQRLSIDRGTGEVAGAEVVFSGALDTATDEWSLALRTGRMRLDPELIRGLEAIDGDAGGSLLPLGLTVGSGSEMALDLELAASPDDAGDVQRVRMLDLDLYLEKTGFPAFRLLGKRIDITDDAIEIEDAVARAPGLEISTPRARIPKAEGEPIRGHFEIRLDALGLDGEVGRILPGDVQEDLAPWLEGRELHSDDLALVAGADGSVRLTGAVRFVVPEGESPGDGPIGTLRFAPLDIRPEAEGPLLAGRIQMEAFGIELGVELRELEGVLAIDRLRLGATPTGTGRIEGLAGRLEGVSIEDVSAPVIWQDGILRLDPIRGRAAGGRLEAHLQVHTREPKAYEGRFVVSGFDVSRLKEDIAPTGPPVSGRADLELTLDNRSGNVEGLRGAGTLRVRDGDLGELPGVANIFAFFSQVLNTQSRPTFERLDLSFTLAGEVFSIRSAQLSGPLFDMRGSGTIDMNLIGDLRFTPHFITSMLLPGALQLPGLGNVLNAVVREDVLYDIRLRGDLTSAEPEIIAIPWTGIDFGRTFEGTGAPGLPRRRVPDWFR